MPHDDDKNGEQTRWSEVQAKATAIVALHTAKLHEKSTLEQAQFLEALGVSRPEAAAMLGVSPTTLYVAQHRAKKKGGTSANPKTRQ